MGEAARPFIQPICANQFGNALAKRHPVSDLIDQPSRLGRRCPIAARCLVPAGRVFGDKIEIGLRPRLFDIGFPAIKQ